MTNIFNNMQVPFTAPAKVAAPEAVKVQDAVAASNVSGTDKVELSSQPKQRKGPIRAVKDFIGGIKKFFASAGEYVKGTVKGIATGAALGSVIYTIGDIANKAKKKTGKAHMVLAGVAAVGSIAANLWNASLNASEKSSNIDHRYSGHQ